ncbi:MAG: trypsin-like serine protease [Oligoflexia bacterium]|nr:trypsin-like serine protease [Oligoflexia bacterium]
MNKFSVFALSALLHFAVSIQFASAQATDVDLLDSQGLICSGQIISPDWIAIEAHCLVGRSPASLIVRAGGSNAAYQQNVAVANFVTHPSYIASPPTNDVGLIQLAYPLVFNQAVLPLESPDASRFQIFVSWICSESGVCGPGPCPAGQALVRVFPNGLAFDSSTQDICVDNLGVFDPATGFQTATNFDTTRNAYVLAGKYLRTNVQSLPPSIQSFGQLVNDFRVSPAGTSASDARQSTLWSSEAHIYYYINRYRNSVLNDGFVSSLGLGSAEAANLTTRQYRPNLQGLLNSRLPWTYANELTSATTGSVSVPANDYFFSSKQRSAVSDPLDSLAFDPSYVVGQYAGALSNWITTGTAQWPSDPTWGNIGNISWKTDIRPAILEGFKLWNAYRATGKTELYKYAMKSLRRWNNYACDIPNKPACDKGWNIDNSMMYLDSADPALNNPSNPSWPSTNSDDTLLFPYAVRSGVGANHFGPQNGSLGGLFVAALFLDLSREVGLGDVKADRLFWKVMSSIDPSQAIDMTAFGNKVQLAARALWPTTSNPNLSWYEQDIVDALSSRGIKMNGVANFLNNLPLPIGVTGNQGPGTLTTTSASGVGSSIPESQRNSTTGYNFLSFFINGYTVTIPGTQYVTYQFYKFSRYAACDALELTNGTINTVSSINPILSYDGSMSVSYQGKSLGNSVLLVPGSALNFLRRRQSCVSEHEGYYPEDIRATGFRVTKAIPNGFTFSVQRLGASSGRINYQLNIVDPSLTLTGANTGPATYNWTFTEFDGTVVSGSGQQVSYAALTDQPFTISIDRVRGAQTDNLTLRERGNDLDRANGRQFNQDYWNVGYPVGFDTIINRRLVEGHGSYVSALNPVGGAFGVQARRWTTPNQLVQPIRLTTVSHGIGSGSNTGNPYQFQNALYYNACIWSSRPNVTSAPGCHTDAIAGDSEQQVNFNQTGLNMLDPFATVTASSYPAYLWSVDFPATWRLQPSTEYQFGSHISASVVSNGYSYNVCSYAQAAGTAGQPNDMSDWLAGANWSGTSGAPAPQTMRQYLGNPNSVSNCTFAGYKFEGLTVYP